MGQKVNPTGFRINTIGYWDAWWFADDNYAKYVEEDYKLRKFLTKSFASAGVSRILIERVANNNTVIVSVAKPSFAIGKKGSNLAEVEKGIREKLGLNFSIKIQEVKRPNSDAKILAHFVSEKMVKRVGFKRAVRMAFDMAEKDGVKGIKIACSGRLDGAEIARTDWFIRGSVPLSKLRAKIDYGTAEAMTIAGVCGIKVWIYKGDVEGKVISEPLTKVVKSF